MYTVKILNVGGVALRIIGNPAKKKKVPTLNYFNCHISQWPSNLCPGYFCTRDGKVKFMNKMATKGLHYTPPGTDGTDHAYRQRIAAQYQTRYT